MHFPFFDWRSWSTEKSKWICNYFRSVHCCRVAKVCHIANLRSVTVSFLWYSVVSPGPTAKLEDHPLSDVRECLFRIFAATFRVSIHNPRTRHAVVRAPHLTWHRKFLQDRGAVTTSGYASCILAFLCPSWNYAWLSGVRVLWSFQLDEQRHRVGTLPRPKPFSVSPSACFFTLISFLLLESSRRGHILICFCLTDPVNSTAKSTTNS
jgi:hypothetical protein